MQVLSNAYLLHISFQNRDYLTAQILFDLLKTWFHHERLVLPGEHYSLATVDTLGTPPLNLNFMTHKVVNAIFEDFGKPLILDYRQTSRNPAMEIAFRSMTEALAASMYFGEWYRFEVQTDDFVFRVRIIPTNLEEVLIRYIGGVPSTTFEMSYFSSENYEKERIINKMRKINRTKRMLVSLWILNFKSGTEMV